MYCKRCKFHAFDHIDACPKCGGNWEDVRKALYLNWLTPSKAWDTPPQNAATPPPLETPADSELDLSAEFDADMAMLDFADSELPSEAAQAPLSAAPPIAPQRSSENDIDVSHIPELDLSVDMPETPQDLSVDMPETPSYPQTEPPTDTPEAIFAEIELELEPLPTPQPEPPQLEPEPTAPAHQPKPETTEETIELDFSLDFEETEEASGAGNGSKRGELLFRNWKKCPCRSKKPGLRPRQNQMLKPPQKMTFFWTLIWTTVPRSQQPPPPRLPSQWN